MVKTVVNAENPLSTSESSDGLRQPPADLPSNLVRRMTVIIVLAKEPVPGRAKTRLCPPLTPNQAAEVAAASLSDTFAAVRQSQRATHAVAVFDGDPQGWVPNEIAVFPQVSGGLDRRLAAAFTTVCSTYGEPAVLIAMDTPQVTAQLLDAAIASIEGANVDAVFGPAEDGGFWLIGLDPHQVGENAAWFGHVFFDVPMSTPTTGKAQRERMTELGLRINDLPTLRDIDTLDDLHMVVAQNPHLKLSSYWQVLTANADTAHAATTTVR